jgi:3-phosphoshikimate 1-carboxyvinyltransferase
VKVAIEGDDLIVEGAAKPKGGATVDTAMDHRIAMSFLVFGSAAQEPVRIDDGSFIATSFPGFVTMLNAAGAKIAAE